MKRLILSIMLILAVASVSTTAFAQIKFGPRGGVNVNKGGDAFVGAQAELSLPLLPITAVPNAEYYFVKDVTSVHLNADVQYTFIGIAVAKLVAGGGYTFAYSKNDTGPSNPSKESGFNLQFGAKASLGMNVFGLLRTTKIGGGSFVNSLVVGLTF